MNDDTEDDLTFEDHPQRLNDLLIPFWFLSSEIRETLTSPAWKDRVANGQNPFFCFHDGFCRYFDTLQKLKEHLSKNPTHSLSPTEMAKLKRQGRSIQEKWKVAHDCTLKKDSPSLAKSSSFEQDKSPALESLKSYRSPEHRCSSRSPSSALYHSSNSPSLPNPSSLSPSTRRRYSKSPPIRQRSSKSPSRNLSSQSSSIRNGRSRSPSIRHRYSRSPTTRYRSSKSPKRYRSSRSPSSVPYHSSRSPEFRNRKSKSPPQQYRKSKSPPQRYRSSKSPTSRNRSYYRSSRSPTWNDVRFRRQSSRSPIYRRTWRRSRSRSPTRRRSTSSSSCSSRSPERHHTSPARRQSSPVRRQSSPVQRPPSPKGSPPQTASRPTLPVVKSTSNLVTSLAGASHQDLSHLSTLGASKAEPDLQAAQMLQTKMKAMTCSSEPVSPNSASKQSHLPAAVLTTKDQQTNPNKLISADSVAMKIPTIVSSNPAAAASQNFPKTSTSSRTSNSMRTMDDIIRRPMTSTPLLIRPDIAPKSESINEDSISLGSTKCPGTLDITGTIRRINIVRPISFDPRINVNSDSQVSTDVPVSPAIKESDIHIQKVVPISLSRQLSEDGPAPSDPRRFKTPKESNLKQVIDLARLPATFQLANDGTKDKSDNTRLPVSSTPPKKSMTLSEKVVTSSEEKRKKQEELLKRVRTKNQKSNSPTKQMNFPPPPTPRSEFSDQNLTQSRKKLTPLIVSPNLQLKPPQPLSAPVILQHTQLTSQPPPSTNLATSKLTMVPPPSPMFQPNCLPPLTPPYSPLIPDIRQPPPNYRPPISSEPHYVQFPPPSPSPYQSSVTSPNTLIGPNPGAGAKPVANQPVQVTRDPRLASKTQPTDCHMVDPSRQESLSKISSCMTAFTSYNFLTSRPITASSSYLTATAKQTPSLNGLPTRQYLFEKPAMSLPSVHQLFGNSSSSAKPPTAPDARTATTFMKRPPSPPPINGDPRKRHFSSDSQLDEYLSKKNRCSRPSSWVVTKSALHAVTPPTEEEVKKQQELQLKANALRERLGVKKVMPKQLISIDYPNLTKQANPISHNKQANPKAIVRVPSPPPPPRISQLPEAKENDVEKTTNSVATLTMKASVKVPTTSNTKPKLSLVKTINWPTPTNSTAQTLIKLSTAASTKPKSTPLKTATRVPTPTPSAEQILIKVSAAASTKPATTPLKSTTSLATPIPSTLQSLNKGTTAASKKPTSTPVKTTSAPTNTPSVARTLTKVSTVSTNLITMKTLTSLPTPTPSTTQNINKVFTPGSTKLTLQTKSAPTTTPLTSASTKPTSAPLRCTLSEPTPATYSTAQNSNKLSTAGSTKPTLKTVSVPTHTSLTAASAPTHTSLTAASTMPTLVKTAISAPTSTTTSSTQTLIKVSIAASTDPTSTPVKITCVPTTTPSTSLTLIKVSTAASTKPISAPINNTTNMPTPTPSTSQTLIKVPTAANKKPTSMPLKTALSTLSCASLKVQNLINIPTKETDDLKGISSPKESLTDVTSTTEQLTIKVATNNTKNVDITSSAARSVTGDLIEKISPKSLEFESLNNPVKKGEKSQDNIKNNLNSSKNNQNLTEKRTQRSIKTNENNNTLILSQLDNDQTLSQTEPQISESLLPNVEKTSKTIFKNAKNYKLESVSNPKNNETVNTIDSAMSNSTKESVSSAIQVSLSTDPPADKTEFVTNSTTGNSGQKKADTVESVKVIALPTSQKVSKMSTLKATVTKGSFGEFQFNVKRKTDRQSSTQKMSKSNLPLVLPELKIISKSKTASLSNEINQVLKETPQTLADSATKTSSKLLLPNKEDNLSKTNENSSAIIACIDSVEIDANLVPSTNSSEKNSFLEDEFAAISDTLDSTSNSFPAVLNPRPKTSKRSRSLSPTVTLTKTEELKIVTKKMKKDSALVENCPAIKVCNSERLDGQEVGKEEMTNKTLLHTTNTYYNQVPDLICTDTKEESEMSHQTESDKLGVLDKEERVDTSVQNEESHGQSLQETLKALSKETQVREVETISNATELNSAVTSVVHLVQNVSVVNPEVKPESPTQGSSLIQTLQDLQDWEERVDIICCSNKEVIVKAAEDNFVTAVEENCRDEVRKVVAGLTSKVDQLVAAVQELEATGGSAKSDGSKNFAETYDRKAVIDLVGDMTSQVEKNVPTHAYSCESNVNKIIEIKSVNQCKTEEGPIIPSQSDVSLVSQTCKLDTLNQKERTQGSQEVNKTTTQVQDIESSQPICVLQQTESQTVDTVLESEKRDQFHPQITRDESAPVTDPVVDSSNQECLTNESPSNVQEPTCLELVVDLSERQRVASKTPVSVMSESCIDVSKTPTTAMSQQLLDSISAPAGVDQNISLRMAEMLKEVDQNFEEHQDSGQPLESIPTDKVRKDKPTPTDQVEMNESTSQSQDPSSLRRVTLPDETLDPFEVKFTDRFSMFKSTVVGISSQVDNEAFLTSALRNFSGTALFETEVMESEREETNPSSIVVEDPEAILDETVLDNQDMLALTKRSKTSSAKKLDKVRRVLKIKVFDEESILEMNDVTASKVQKQFVANPNTEDPKPHATVFRRRRRGGRKSLFGEENNDNKSGPLVIQASKSRSIDQCPRCNADLNALSGGYTLNLSTFDVSVTCVDCHTNIVIKDSFLDLKAFKM